MDASVSDVAFYDGGIDSQFTRNTYTYPTDIGVNIARQFQTVQQNHVLQRIYALLPSLCDVKFCFLLQLQMVGTDDTVLCYAPLNSRRTPCEIQTSMAND